MADDLASISERPTAGDTAALGLSLQAATGGVGDAHPLLLADDALEAEDEIVDRAGGHRVERDAVIAEDLRHVLDMLLIPAETINVLDDQDLDPALDERLQDLLETGTLHRRPTDPIVAMERFEREATGGSIGRSRDALIVDGGRPVVRVVEALASVADRILSHAVPPTACSGCPRDPSSSSK
ncbi:hypothetical protein KZX46_10410 [Polymorphobacter sp. PAMC 29334]|nr:hypothetical protein [Polymorphobacter sp. PAMC 29334]QYE36295.1 hypothetical protein KZX46_10410 [Polymorphobacter sp. PAMC 29334]